MEWKFYSFDKRPVNYEDLSKNEEIATGIKKKPEISENYKIGNKIYNVCMLDLENHYAGVHEVKFIDTEEVEETLETEFTCPYCGYVYNDAFELDYEGEINCPRCNSKLEYTKQITIEYEVKPVKRAAIIKV